MRVKVVSDADALAIFIDDIPHAAWFWKYFRGFQSFNNGVYTIEVLLKDQNLTLEYDDRDLWVEILREIYDKA